MSHTVLKNKSLSHLVDERRGRPRTAKNATIAFTVGENSTSCPVIEMSNYGARIVLNHNTNVNQTIEIRAITSRLTIKGKARVAWTSPLTNGRAVVGLEFLEVSRSFGA